MHAYEKDPQSGAGNCVCGGSELHVRHPHEFREAWIWAQRVGEVRCVCSRPKSDPVHHSTDPHTEPLGTFPEPVKSGLDSSHMDHTNRSHDV